MPAPSSQCWTPLPPLPPLACSTVVGVCPAAAACAPWGSPCQGGCIEMRRVVSTSTGMDGCPSHQAGNSGQATGVQGLPSRAPPRTPPSRPQRRTCAAVRPPAARASSASVPDSVEDASSQSGGSSAAPSAAVLATACCACCRQRYQQSACASAAGGGAGRAGVSYRGQAGACGSGRARRRCASGKFPSPRVHICFGYIPY